MAKSPAHRFGQLIGDLLENTLIRYCQPVAAEYGMYLDYRHPRPARKNQKDVKWKDINGNTHKLDIVIESDGTEWQIGQPKAFIEMAWRRYTKHSKNKAQEISDAIKPLVSRYSESAPFYGAVLASVFTESSLHQMRSEGFKLLYFSIQTIENAFASQGIHIHWDEDTPESDLQAKADQLENLSRQQWQMIGDHLMSENQAQWQTFLQCLRNALERRIQSIHVTSLYGITKNFCDIIKAYHYITHNTAKMTPSADTFYGYEIIVTYSNGDSIKMQFKERQAALAGLRKLMP